RVGVLRGGPSGEYEVSLASGASVLEHLPHDKYSPFDIFIDRKGKWHWSGMAAEPSKILKHLDVVFNALHGEYGEDGKVQKLLENLFVPFTGSPSLPSALAMNKALSKKIFEKAGLKIPRYRVLKKEEVNYLKTFEAFSSLAKPLVVKPATAGSSLGVSIVDSLESFSGAINEALKYSSAVIIEECIKGKEVTCGVVESFRDNRLFSLPPIEIRPPNEATFFDYQAKYSGKTQEICPAEISPEETKRVQEIASKAHRALGLRHYSRADMIIGEDGEIYLLETNTLPGLTAESLLPKSLKACGCEFGEFLDHLLTLALYKRR
ncbi:MAG: D-alanine-D-alanine ligase, partial [Parcubacteria group bacterium Gr01-1014_107]